MKLLAINQETELEESKLFGEVYLPDAWLEEDVFSPFEFFVAQINLEQVKSEYLPQKGYLYFFVEAYSFTKNKMKAKVRYFKEDEKGVAAMCKVMEDMRNETAKNATIQATVNHIRDIMETFGVTIEKAMETLKIPVAQRDMYAGLVAKKTQ